MNDRQSVTRGRKFEQVRNGASGIFLRDGFAAASVDDIARAARVSKATLYSYFPDKKLMFAEVLGDTLKSILAAPPFEQDSDSPAHEGLPPLLMKMAQFLVSAPLVQLHRIMVAEATRFPDSARAYQRAIRDCVLSPLAAQLDLWVARRELRIADTQISARQLMMLVGGDLQQQALLSGHETPEPERIRKVCDSAAGMFLAAHAPGTVAAA